MADDSKPRVFATRELPGEALGSLAEVCELEIWPGPGAPGRQALLASAGQAEGMLCLLSETIDSELLEALPNLRVISSYSVGTDHIDLEAASLRGIPVGHTPGVLTETTADLTWALLLAAARRIPEAHAFVQDGSWSRKPSWEPDLLLGRDVHGATLGLIGLGAIGQAVARRAMGFGMRVLGWNRSPREVPGVERASLGEVLHESDFLSLHVARSPETVGLIGRAEIEAMRDGAILINTARGGIVDEGALLAALKTGKLAAAGLDVFDREPIDLQSPLRSLSNLVLAPHLGSASVATRAAMAELAVENLRLGLAGRPMTHCANPDVYA